jgi:PAS domain S-box-containing protein/putative nucleotidyltransferase with HDIG domain
MCRPALPENLCLLNAGEGRLDMPILYMIPSAVAAIVVLAVALFAFLRRSTPGSAALMWVMLAVAVWSLGYTLELGSNDLPVLLFWSNVQYLGIVAVPVTWLVFTLHYTRREKWVTRRTLALLAIIPLITTVLTWTNSSLMQYDVALDTGGPFAVILRTRGAWFWVHTAYSYGLLFLAAVLLVEALVRSPHLYRGQAGTLLATIAFPWIGNVLYLSNLNPIAHLDLTPLAFALSGLATALGLLHFRLLDLVPVARDALVESMSDAIMVLDEQDRIVDLNPAAQQIIGHTAQKAIGQPAAQVLSRWPDWMERYAHVIEAHHEVSADEQGAGPTYDLHISPLFDWRRRVSGRLIVLRDITRYKRLEQALRRAHDELAKRYRDLFEEAPAMYVITRRQTDGPVVSNCNQLFLDTLGYSRAEVVGRPLAEFYAPKSRAMLIGGGYERALMEEGITEERELLARDGGGVETLLRAMPETDSDGQVIGTRSMFVDIRERKRTEELLHRTLEIERALSGISARFLQASDFDQAVSASLADIGRLSGASRAYLFLLRENGSIMGNTHEWCAEGVTPEIDNLRNLRTNTFPWWMKKVRAGEVIHVSDLAQLPPEAGEEKKFLEMQGIKSLLVLPVYAGAELVGFIGFDNVVATNAWRQEDLAMLRVAAEIVGSALQRKQVEEAEREQRVLAEALRDTAAALNSTLNFDEVLDRILANVGRVVPHDTASVMLIESGVARMARCQGFAERGTEAEVMALELRIADLLPMRWMVETRQPVVIQDTRTYPGWVEIPETGWIRSWVGAPICVADQVIGILNLDSAVPDFFTPAHAARLQAFADQAAMALENARLLAEAQRRGAEFAMLYDTTSELSAHHELPVLLQTVVERAVALLHAPGGGIYLYDATRDDVELVVVTGTPTPPLGARLRMGEGMAGRVAQTRQPLIVNDYHTWEHHSSQYDHLPFTGAAEVPMLYRGELIGVLVVNEIGTMTRQFTEADVRLLSLFAAQAAGAVHNARLFEETRQLFSDLQRSNVELTRAYDTTLEGWSRALELRDAETEGHTLRVTQIAETLARSMGISEEDLSHVRRGALLHDIGKMGIPDSILLKPGPLTDEEWVIMRKHPVYAYNLLSPIDYLKPALDIPYTHHEKWDGTGYPRGLKGEQIPLAGRIFAVADVWDALTSDRPYRPAWPKEKALKHIQEQAGKHFDPEVVSVFLGTDWASGNTSPPSEPDLRRQTFEVCGDKL